MVTAPSRRRRVAMPPTTSSRLPSASQNILRRKSRQTETKGRLLQNSTGDPAARNELSERLLKPLLLCFLAGDQAYSKYMAGGKTYFFACELRRINASARALLLEHGHRLPAHARDTAVALLRHYDTWMRLWDDLSARQRPSPDATFIFDNPVRFPREARLALIALYEELAE